MGWEIYVRDFDEEKWIIELIFWIKSKYIRIIYSIERVIWKFKFPENSKNKKDFHKHLFLIEKSK